MAMGSEHIPEALRGSGLALLGTATSITRLFASILFGVLWTLVGVETAIALFAAGLVVAMALAVAGSRWRVRSRTVAFAALAGLSCAEVVPRALD